MQSNLHRTKLLPAPVGTGGSIALLYPSVFSATIRAEPPTDPIVDLGEQTIEIGDRTDIGAAICRFQANVGANERLRLRFIDGGTWIGNVTLSREDDDVTFKVEGAIFGGAGDDRGVALSFLCEPDGPIGLPIIARDCDGSIVGFYTDDDPDLDTSNSTLRAAFYADSTCWTAANAPKVAPPRGNATERAGAKLAKQAASAAAEWKSSDDKSATNKALWAKIVQDARKGVFGGGNVHAKMQAAFQQAKATLENLDSPSESESWPRPMPKPVRPPADPKAKRSVPTVGATPEERSRGYVVKRVRT